ncbi:MAG: hypothetical protein OIF47_08160 [Marinibacterium sp.]|nr:hypothetical protein [Marinibacterium sp.]
MLRLSLMVMPILALGWLAVVAPLPHYAGALRLHLPCLLCGGADPVGLVASGR